MDTPYGQLNLNLHLDLDIDVQKQTKANGINNLYKLKVAKRFEHIIFAIFILAVVNNLYIGYIYMWYQFYKRVL